MEDTMKRIILLILLIAFGVSASASETDDIRAELDGKLGLNNQGTEFWLSVPDMFFNELTEKFYVSISTRYENKIRIKFNKTGKDSIFTLKPNSSKLVKVYPNKKLGYYFSWYESETPKYLESAGINIISVKPITVQSLNNYYGFKNGTIVQPISSLGKEYMLQSYIATVYKGTSVTSTSSPELIVTSAYENTKVKLLLAKSNKKLRIRLQDNSEYTSGDTIELEMNQGDVWYINSADTLGDLSGSKLIASKPVHLTYSHYDLRLFKNSNRSNDIYTTIFPTKQWGKEYFIPSFSELHEHPIIRIYTEHDNNKIYRNGELWINIDNTFENKVFESRLWSDDEEIKNNVPTIITSEKPISILLFPDFKIVKSHSSLETDTVNIINKNVSTLVPLEQATNYAQFSVVDSRDSYYNQEKKINKLELYFVSDKEEKTNDIEFAIVEPNDNLLEWKSIKLDTSNSYEAIRIKDKFYCRFSKMLPDTCEIFIKSTNVKFSGFYYIADLRGVPFFGPSPPTIDYLAFPISTNSLDLTSTDTTTPKVTLNKMSNKTHGIVYDFDENASGLAELYMLEEYSYNYNYKLLSADDGFIENEDGNSFISGEPMQLEFDLIKKDNERDAFAVLYTTDKAGNDTLIFVNEELFTSVETETEQNITIYNDEIIIDERMAGNNLSELIIFNLNGSIAKSINNPESNRISISELNSGTYFVVLKSSEYVYSKKFSVVR